MIFMGFCSKFNLIYMGFWHKNVGGGGVSNSQIYIYMYNIHYNIHYILEDPTKEFLLSVTS